MYRTTSVLVIALSVGMMATSASAMTLHLKSGSSYECETSAAACERILENRKYFLSKGTFAKYFHHHFSKIEPIVIEAEAPSVPGVPSGSNGGSTGGSSEYAGNGGGTSNGPSPVPLPAAGWMLLAGVGGLAAMRRRNRG